jgi:septal ring factor EnvC (AmiA/AmiB activator)
MGMDSKTILDNLKKLAPQLPKSKIPDPAKGPLQKAVAQSIKDLEDTVKTSDKLKQDLAAWKSKRKELERSLTDLKAALPGKRQHYKDALDDLQELRTGSGTDPAVSNLFVNFSALYANGVNLPEGLSLDDA